MRLSSELYLLLILTLSPLLLLAAYSLHAPVQTEWILAACAMSILLAIMSALRIRKLVVHPLKSITDDLYANIEPPRKHQPPEWRQLVRAIRFFSAGTSVDAINRINNLEEQLRVSINASESDKQLLEEERQSLAKTRDDLSSAEIHLEMQRLLARETVARLFASAGSNLSTDAVLALQDLQFLLSESHHIATTGNNDLLMLIDRVTSIAAPLARSRNIAFHVEFTASCPHQFVLDGGQFVSRLFLMLTDFLLAADENEDLSGQVFIQVAQTSDGVSVSLAADKSLDNTMRLPATPSHRAPANDRELTAIVVGDDERVRSSLAHRLALLGISCITDFKSLQIDICMVVDETSETFLAIRPYLPEGAFVLMLNNRQHYPDPRWITVSDPVSQAGLDTIISDIGKVKNIANQNNVLVVDDSEVNVQLLEPQLLELGHKVTVSRTGESAVSEALDQHFEIIFMDIQLPGIDGLEATRRIREHNQAVVIAGLTAHATREEKQQCLDAGMNHVLIKPVRMETLRSLVSNLGDGDALPPIAATRSETLPIFDLDQALANAGDRPELAAELFGLLLDTLPGDLDAINAASGNTNELKKAVHKLHGAIRYCGVPRLANAIEKLELALKQGNDGQVVLLLNLLNGEATALAAWYRDNPDVLGPKPGEINQG